MGIAIHNATSSDAAKIAIDLAAGVRQDAAGILGTTTHIGDLVSYLVISMLLIHRRQSQGHRLYVNGLDALPLHVPYSLLAIRTPGHVDSLAFHAH